MATPQNVNVFLKKIKNIVIQEKFDLIQEEVDAFMVRDFDPNYINENDIEKIKNELELIIIFGFVESSCGAMSSINVIRKILDTVFVKHLWFVNRFLKTPEDDIGTLAFLPDLALFEIQNRIYHEL